MHLITGSDVSRERRELQKAQLLGGTLLLLYKKPREASPLLPHSPLLLAILRKSRR
jgi:hypothetical protein